MYLKEFNDIVVKGMLGELLEDCLLFHVERAGCSTQVCDDKDGVFSGSCASPQEWLPCCGLLCIVQV